MKRTRTLSMPEGLALTRAERDGYLIDPSHRQRLWPWWMAHCRMTKQPFIAGCPKQRYAIIEVSLCFPREFTEAGREQGYALLRAYSQGVKSWSASGGYNYLFCQKIPVLHVHDVAEGLRQHIDEWTIVPDLAESMW